MQQSVPEIQALIKEIETDLFDVQHPVLDHIDHVVEKRHGFMWQNVSVVGVTRDYIDSRPSEFKSTAELEEEKKTLKETIADLEEELDEANLLLQAQLERDAERANDRAESAEAMRKQMIQAGLEFDADLFDQIAKAGNQAIKQIQHADDAIVNWTGKRTRAQRKLAAVELYGFTRQA